MRLRGLAAALLLAPALLFGQLGSGTVTVTASNTANPQPDQAIFDISVNSGSGQSLDGVVTALASTGISAANLSSLNFQQGAGHGGATGLVWAFSLTVPVSQIKNTTSALLSLENTIAQNNSGLTLSFDLQGTQVSSQLAQNCDFGALISSARGKAQAIAGATGFSIGAVVGLSGNIIQSIPTCALTVTFGLPVSRSGPNTITISASRTSNPLPDQALIQLSVNSSPSAGLNDINTALAGAGIAGATFTGISDDAIFDPNSATPSPIQWTFTLTAPLAKLSSTLAQLVAAQQTIVQQNSSLSLSFSIQSLQSSQASQPACDEAGLISDARSQAQTLAAASGVGLGAILNLSDQGAPGEFETNPPIVTYAGFLLGQVALSSIQSQTCGLSVQFQLL